MKYKIGDRIRVRKDLKERERYYSEDKERYETMTLGMLELCGEVVTIKNVYPKVGVYTIHEYGWNWTDEMFEDISKFNVGDRVKVIAQYGDNKHTVGKIGTVVDADDAIGIVFDDYINGHTLGGRCKNGHGWHCYAATLERIGNNEKIVITTDGTTTTAKRYNGKKVIKSAEAKCSPEDKFDFEHGVGIAISRLLDWTYVHDEKSTLKYNGKVVCIDVGHNKGTYTVGKIYQFVDGIITSNGGTKFTNDGAPFASFEEFANWTSAKFIEVVE